MNLKQNTNLMKNQTFGVEIEFSGISQLYAIGVVAKTILHRENIDNEIYHVRYDHDGTILTGLGFRDEQGRQWQIVGDGSVRYSQTNDDIDGGCGELVTPVLKYDEIETLQSVVRALRGVGAVSSHAYNCGLHIHVGADIDKDGGHTPKSLRNLANIMASHEPLLVNAINTNRDRLFDWCQMSNETFITQLNRQKPRTLQAFKKLWYKAQGFDDISTAYHNHYHRSRYHCLNYHNIWLKMLSNELNKCTIEFRLFEFHKNMHCGELRAYIQLCLALSNYAKMVNFASPTPIDISNEKYAMKNWLNNLGFFGDEFKTARKMLTKRLHGDTAYRNGRVHGVNDLDDLGLAE